MLHDAIVIGGSYAGMAAALQLARARRSVLVIDAGRRRNRFSGASHGFLGQDGADPAEIAGRARDQLLRYPSVRWVEGLAERAEGARDSFAVVADGQSHAGRRLLFATGVADALPQVEGLAERWGRSVFHCPYCHGYELDEGPIGVIATGASSLHQAMLLPEWGKVTLLANGMVRPDDAERADLEARGVAVEEEAIAGLEGHAHVRLADGRLLSFAGLFTATRTTPATPVAERLGCAMKETPLGLQIGTDDAKETSVRGAFACGDVARMPHSVSLAVGDGAWAGLQMHRSLVF